MVEKEGAHQDEERGCFSSSWLLTVMTLITVLVVVLMISLAGLLVGICANVTVVEISVVPHQTMRCFAIPCLCDLSCYSLFAGSWLLLVNY